MGTAPGTTPRESLPFILRRQRGNKVWFAAVYTLHEKEGSRWSACLTDDGVVSVTGGRLFDQFRVLRVGPERSVLSTVESERRGCGPEICGDQITYY